MNEITVIKRTGRHVEFDATKIERAILKAMKYGSGIVNEKLARDISLGFESEKTVVTIKEIEDYVYKALVNSGDMLTAKYYEAYRAVREYQRQRNTIDNKVLGVVTGEEKDVLTIADEVQTGVGRTGKFLAGENFGKRANITTLAKGIAGGLPMGICLADEKCCDVLSASTHGSTFGGNPVSSAGAMAVLEKVNKDFMEEVIRKGVYLKGKLLEIEEIERVDGMGLMLGAKLKTKKAGDVVKKAVENGVIVLTAKEKLRFLPPLTISFAEIDKGIEILKGLLTE